jgi:hypothetical protein
MSSRRWGPFYWPMLHFFFRAFCEMRSLTARSTSCFLANFLAEGFLLGVGRGVFNMGATMRYSHLARQLCAIYHLRLMRWILSHRAT